MTQINWFSLDYVKHSLFHKLRLHSCYTQSDLPYFCGVNQLQEENN
jgi:hypothetical protein